MLQSRSIEHKLRWHARPAASALLSLPASPPPAAAATQHATARTENSYIKTYTKARDPTLTLALLRCRQRATTDIIALWPRACYRRREALLLLLLHAPPCLGR